MTVDSARFATRAVHAARTRETAASRATPIYLTAGFEFDGLDHAADHFRTGTGFGYTRTGNPTVRAVERQLAALESGADAVLVASGQAAVATALLTVAGAGDHIVSSTHIYEGTRGLFLDNLARLDIGAFIGNIADPSLALGDTPEHPMRCSPDRSPTRATTCSTSAPSAASAGYSRHYR